jgi:ankyrin repeat protein
MDNGYDVYEYSRKNAIQDLRDALKNGSKPDDYIAYDGSTALVMAARCGHAAIVKELIAFGASTDIRTDEGSSLLHHAVSGKSMAVLDAALACNIAIDDPNEDGVTPLILAAHYGLCDIVQRLCAAGADVNLEASGWGTALDAANGDVAALLESRGGKRSQKEANQPLAKGAERYSYGCFESGADLRAHP